MNAPRGNPSPTTRPGISSFAYQTYKATLAAGQFLPVTITGNYVRCISANLPSFKLGIDGMPAQFFTQGLKVKLLPGQTFAEIDIDNTGNAAPLSVTLAVGSGDLDDSRVSGATVVSSAVGANAIPGSIFVPNAATQIDATTGRQSLTLRNLDQGETLYIGKDNTVGLPPNPPAAPALGSVVAGALAATTYFVRLSYVTATGESLPGPEANLAVAANSVLTVTSPPAAGSGGAAATGYNVYVSNTGGGGSGFETKQAGPIAIGTNWQEPNTGLIAGTAMPTVSSAVSNGYPVLPGEPLTIDHSNGPVWGIANLAAPGARVATLVEV